MKRREEKATGFQFSTICRQLKLASADGKKVVTANNYLTDKPKPKLPPKSE